MWAPRVFIAALLLFSALALRAQRPLPDRDILQYLGQTISWYRNVTALGELPADSRQAMFADGLRQNSTEAVRLAFEFAIAEAAIPSMNTQDAAAPDETRRRTLAQSAAAAEQKAEQAQAEIEQLNRQLESASPSARVRLLALRDEVTSEANFAKARRDALRTLIGFLSTPDEGGLAGKIADLERTVPEAAAVRHKAAGAQAAAAEPAPAARPIAARDFHPESAGIVGLTTEVFSVSQTMGRLDRLAQQTDTLRQAADKLRAPLRTALREVIQRGDAVAQAPES